MSMDIRSPQMLLLGVVLVGLLVAAAFLLPMLLSQSKNKDLLESGAIANARVLELSKTGISRGPNTPLVRLKLEVQPSQGQGPPFQVELEMGVSVVDLPKLQPGSVVAVRYDPRDHGNVLIVP
jgi:hypothetical protein